MHASSGIAFNHESPLRGREFVTRKVTLALARIRHGQLDVLELGNLNAERDWGFAADYVEGMWRMLQQDAGDDYVLATGVAHSVRDFVGLAGRAMGFDIVFEGSGREERGVDRKSGREIVRVNPEFYRPAEVDKLIGASERALQKLGWKARTTFPDLVTMMAEADDKRLRDNTVLF